MKVIKLSRKRVLSEGAFGRYYRLSIRRGLKVLRTNHGDELPKTLKELECDDLYRQAKKELKLLKKAQRSGCTPKGYEVVAIKFKHGYAPGIVMQHIKGRHYDDSGFTNDPWYEEACKKAIRKLSAVKIRHNDIHGENVIITGRGRRKRLYIIDFTPLNIRII